jgi:general secretion pathway protein D
MKLINRYFATVAGLVSGPRGVSGAAFQRALMGLLLAALLISAGSLAYANDGARLKAAKAKPPVKAQAKAPAKAWPATFSLDFMNTDIIDVLKALSTQSGANIVATSGVAGKTTLSLRNVTLEEALHLVAASNGLDYTWTGVAYVVGKPEEIRNLRVKDLSSRMIMLHQVQPKFAQGILNQVAPDVTVSFQEGSQALVLIGTEEALNRAEKALAELDVPQPPTTKIIPLLHAKAETVLALLQGAAPEATVQLGPQENSLVVTADGFQMDQIMELVKGVDVVPSAEQAFTAIYDVKFARVEELKKTLAIRFPDLKVVDGPRSYTPGIQQASQSGGIETGLLSAPQASGGSSSTIKEMNGLDKEASRVERLILMGAEYTVQQSLELLKSIDMPSKQVKISAVISRVNRDKLNQIGIEWGSSLTSSLGKTGIPFSVGENGGTSRDLKVGAFTRGALSFPAELRALANGGYAKILSQPNVLTLDGREVAFHSGDKIFYQTVISISTSGTPVYDIREIDTGVILVVTPQIHPNGEITLTLAPSFSTATLRTSLGSELPTVNQRTAIATVRVKSGENIVLAGLVDDTVTTSESKVPLLGDIPLLGQLFRSNTKQHTQDELVISVTPEIVE